MCGGPAQNVPTWQKSPHFSSKISILYSVCGNYKNTHTHIDRMTGCLTGMFQANKGSSLSSVHNITIFIRSSCYLESFTYILMYISNVRWQEFCIFASCNTTFRHETSLTLSPPPFSSAPSLGCDLREEMCDIMELLENTEECLTQRELRCAPKRDTVAQIRKPGSVWDCVVVQNKYPEITSAH